MRNLLLYFLLLTSAVFFIGCEKDKNKSSVPNNEKTIIKILGADAGKRTLALDVVPGDVTLEIIDVRRDAVSNADLQKTLVVKVAMSNSVLTQAFPGISQLPSNVYTNHADNPFDGQNWTVTFQPGEFSKKIKITLNPSNLLALGNVGLGFLLADAGDAQISGDKGQIAIEISAKNKWDGVYAVTGPMVDNAVPALVQWNNNNATTPLTDPFVLANGGAWEAHLITTGPTECIVFDNTIWGTIGHPILNGGGHSGYGSMGIVIKFDAGSNNITSIHNFYGDPTRGGATALGNPGTGSGPPNYAASNTRRIDLDPSGVNAVQGNKNILIKYFMYQPSVIAGVRTSFNETWKYVGPR